MMSDLELHAEAIVTDPFSGTFQAFADGEGAETTHNSDIEAAFVQFKHRNGKVVLLIDKNDLIDDSFDIRVIFHLPRKPILKYYWKKLLLTASVIDVTVCDAAERSLNFENSFGTTIQYIPACIADVIPK